MQKIYVVNGLPLSGKTEFGKHVGEQLRERYKFLAHILNRPSQSIVDAFWRLAMSELKIEITKAYPDLIHEFVLNKIATIPEPYVAFVDIREPENIQGFRDYCHHQRKCVETSAIMVKSDGAQEFKNYSDLSIDNYKYDIVINNPRTAFVSDEVALWFLRCRARTFVEQEVLEGRPKERFY